MRKKINYEKVTFLGGFGGEPPKKKEIRSLQLLCSNWVSEKVEVHPILLRHSTNRFCNKKEGMKKNYQGAYN